MRIKNTDAGILKVPGAVIVDDGMSMEEKIRRVEEGRMVCQALFKALQPYALTQSEHPAFKNL